MHAGHRGTFHQRLGLTQLRAHRCRPSLSAQAAPLGAFHSKMPPGPARVPRYLAEPGRIRLTCTGCGSTTRTVLTYITVAFDSCARAGRLRLRHGDASRPLQAKWAVRSPRSGWDGPPPLMAGFATRFDPPTRRRQPERVQGLRMSGVGAIPSASSRSKVSVSSSAMLHRITKCSALSRFRSTVSPSTVNVPALS